MESMQLESLLSHLGAMFELTFQCHVVLELNALV